MSLRKKITSFIVLIVFNAAHILPIYPENGSQPSSQEETFNTGEDADLEQESNGNSIANELTGITNIEVDDNNKQQQFKSFSRAKIIALNKITAKSKEIILKIGQPQYFGNIEIKVHKCLKSLDPYLPNNNILLTIIEQKIDEDQMTIFQGWLISSNISLSTFEHPVYEIFAKDCL